MSRHCGVGSEGARGHRACVEGGFHERLWLLATLRVGFTAQHGDRCTNRTSRVICGLLRHRSRGWSSGRHPRHRGAGSSEAGQDDGLRVSLRELPCAQSSPSFEKQGGQNPRTFTASGFPVFPARREGWGSIRGDGRAFGGGEMDGFHGLPGVGHRSRCGKMGRTAGGVRE